jgi:DNA-binding MarR family transcriptional regulator
MHATLRRMRARGLVALLPTTDGRGALVAALTDRGRHVYEEAEQRLLATERLIQGAIGADQHTQLACGLRRYIRAVEALWNRPTAATWYWQE